MQSVVPAIFAIGFPVIWVALSLFMSSVGGWAALAARYPDRNSERGPTYYLRSGAVGAVGYRSCLILRVCDNGLRMSVLFPFRIGHPPLFIPWDQFHNAEIAWFLFFPRIDAYVGLPVVASVSLPVWLRSHVPLDRSRKAEPPDAMDSR
jgi:hypothetical protein